MSEHLKKIAKDREEFDTVARVTSVSQAVALRRATLFRDSCAFRPLARTAYPIKCVQFGRQIRNAEKEAWSVVTSEVLFPLKFVMAIFLFEKQPSCRRTSSSRSTFKKKIIKETR